MPIIFDQFNSIFIGGRRGRKFEVRFCPRCIDAPWGVCSSGNGYYFATLGEALAFAAGRGWIEPHLRGQYQQEIAAALNRKRDEQEE